MKGTEILTKEHENILKIIESINKECKYLEKGKNIDKNFWEKVIDGEEPEVPTAVREGNTRLSPNESPVVVSGEIVEGLWEEDFTSMDEQHIIADLRERLKLLGLDPNQAEEVVKKSKQGEMIRRQRISPCNHNENFKKRENELMSKQDV